MARQRRVAYQPGATPGDVSEQHLPPLQGAPISRFLNQARCPGLEYVGAFSAGIKVKQIQIYEP